MKEIFLRNKNLVALVDDEDFVELSKYHWFAIKRARRFYAARNIKIDKKRTQVLMHKMILQNCLILDHKDGNGLNNQRNNLRRANSQQNSANMVSQKVMKSSKYKGILIDRRGVNIKYCARIGYNGKTRHIGCFNSEIDAAKAYDVKALELFGEFARLNFERCPEVPNSKANASS